MATIKEYKGSIGLSGGLTPKGGQTHALMEAHDVLVDRKSGVDTRLDKKLENLTKVSSALAKKQNVFASKDILGAVRIGEGLTVNDLGLLNLGDDVNIQLPSEAEKFKVVGETTPDDYTELEFLNDKKALAITNTSRVTVDGFISQKYLLQGDKARFNRLYNVLTTATDVRGARKLYKLDKGSVEQRLEIIESKGLSVANFPEPKEYKDGHYIIGRPGLYYVYSRAYHPYYNESYPEHDFRYGGGTIYWKPGMLSKRVNLYAGYYQTQLVITPSGVVYAPHTSAFVAGKTSYLVGIAPILQEENINENIDTIYDIFYLFNDGTEIIHIEIPINKKVLWREIQLEVIKGDVVIYSVQYLKETNDLRLIQNSDTSRFEGDSPFNPEYSDSVMLINELENNINVANIDESENVFLHETVDLSNYPEFDTLALEYAKLAGRIKCTYAYEERPWGVVTITKDQLYEYNNISYNKIPEYGVIDLQNYTNTTLTEYGGEYTSLEEVPKNELSVGLYVMLTEPYTLKEKVTIELNDEKGGVSDENGNLSEVTIDRDTEYPSGTYYVVAEINEEGTPLWNALGNISTEPSSYVFGGTYRLSVGKNKKVISARAKSLDKNDFNLPYHQNDMIYFPFLDISEIGYITIHFVINWRQMYKDGFTGPIEVEYAYEEI